VELKTRINQIKVNHQRVELRLKIVWICSKNLKCYKNKMLGIVLNAKISYKLTNKCRSIRHQKYSF